MFFSQDCFEAPPRYRVENQNEAVVTLADYSLAAFALLNGGRAIAYFPQIVRVYRDPNGATAISVMTWSLFAAANIATVLYSIIQSGDWIMARVFTFNTLACLTIVTVTLWKRVRHGLQRTRRAADLCSIDEHEIAAGERRLVAP